MTLNHACWEEKLQTTTGLKQLGLREAGDSIVGDGASVAVVAVAGGDAVAVAARRQASAVLEVVLRTSWLRRRVGGQLIQGHSAEQAAGSAVARFNEGK
jgi:hypothetical protein